MTNVPTLPGEEWRLVPEVGGVLVSSLGRCYRIPGKVMNRGNGKRDALWGIKGGMIASRRVCINGKDHAIKDLVATAWIGPRPESHLSVRFKDGDTSNLRVDNLMWAARYENNKVLKRCYDINGRTIKINQERGGISR